MTSVHDLPNAPFDAGEDVPSNPTANATLGDVIARRVSRRDLIRGALAVSVMTATVGPLAMAAAPQAARAGAGPKAQFD